MIDDGISKSLWRRRTKNCICLRVCARLATLKARPLGAQGCRGGQGKLGQIKVIKNPQINNAFYIRFTRPFSDRAESAERRAEAEAEMNPDPTKRRQIGCRYKSPGSRQVFHA